jgi:hypothetical protein
MGGYEESLISPTHPHTSHPASQQTIAPNFPQRVSCDRLAYEEYKRVAYARGVSKEAQDAANQKFSEMRKKNERVYAEAFATSRKEAAE